MIGYMTVTRMLRHDTKVEVSTVDRHPDDHVIRIDDDGTYLTFHLNADTADVADRIAAAFTKAAAGARAAKAAEVLA
ncbi:MAG TPA: hypothetical protein VHP62_01860 [Usitatibacter sp.]|jgi:hypothetical protein|nr:hypothetical protein [Usitatibacter sp.]